MVNKRNRIVELIDFIESQGVEVNLCKNKARGNKGFFSVRNNKYRIDISKNIDDNEMFDILIHEFAHYVHYLYDKKLESLDFIFNEVDDEIWEELITLTVDTISQENAKQLFAQKEKINEEINLIVKNIKKDFPDFSKTKNHELLKKKLKKTDLKYLQSHDNVKVFTGLCFKFYSIKNIDKDFQQESQLLKNYIIFLSKQRILKRINSKINRLNKYYNSPTELFARAFTTYVTKKYILEEKAPKVLNQFDFAIKNNQIPIINKALNII